MRNNSYCNRSVDGAEMRAILMGVFQTLKQQNADVTKTTVNALQQFLITKILPNLTALFENFTE
jgi:hypothetical protein